MPKWHPLTSAFRLRPSSSTGTTDPGTSPGGGANLERDRVRQGAPGALAVEAGMVEGVDFESCRMKFFGCLDVVGGVGGRDGGEVILFFFMSFQVFSIQFPRFDLPRSAPTARAARTVQNTQAEHLQNRWKCLLAHVQTVRIFTLLINSSTPMAETFPMAFAISEDMLRLVSLHKLVSLCAKGRWLYKHTLLVDIPPNRLTIFPGPEGFKSFETRPGQKLVTGSSDRVFLWEVGRVKVFFSADEVPSRVLTHYVEYRTSLTMR